jgi:hypothetical protein
LCELLATPDIIRFNMGRFAILFSIVVALPVIASADETFRIALSGCVISAAVSRIGPSRTQPSDRQHDETGRLTKFILCDWLKSFVGDAALPDRVLTFYAHLLET